MRNRTCLHHKENDWRRSTKKSHDSQLLSHYSPLVPIIPPHNSTLPCFPRKSLLEESETLQKWMFQSSLAKTMGKLLLQPHYPPIILALFPVIPPSFPIIPQLFFIIPP